MTKEFVNAIIMPATAPGLQFIRTSFTRVKDDYGFFVILDLAKENSEFELEATDTNRNLCLIIIIRCSNKST